MAAEAERFADLVRLSPGACLLVSGGVVEAVNAETVEVTGIPEERLVGVPLTELLLPELEPAWHDGVRRAQSGGVAPAVARVRSRLGATLEPVELSLRHLGEDHLIVGLRGTAAEHHYSALAGAELTHDPVTGLANRYHLLALLHHRITSADRNPLALVGLWVDELPKLAGVRGDRAAERVVREVGQRLQSRLRSPDVLGRFDDSGFLALLGSEAPPSQLTEIAERLRGEVAFPVEVDNGLASFTASVAVASITSRRASIHKALSQLEAAAARAAQGGNRTEILDV